MIVATSSPTRPEILYQRFPRDESLPNWKKRRSWTHSRESYQKNAKREYELLLANHRQANHKIVIGFLKEYFIWEILAKYKIIKEWLRKQKIVAYIFIEITEDGYGNPANRIHCNFLVDSRLSESRLRMIFKEACTQAGFRLNEDCRVLYSSINSRDEFIHEAKYGLKFDRFADQAILFRPKTGINKVDRLGNWFIDANGEKISKHDLWETCLDKWFPGRCKPKQETGQKPLEATTLIPTVKLSFRMSRQSDRVIVHFSVSIRWQAA